jgi:hypothetical protein
MQAFVGRYDLHRIGSCFWFRQSLGVSHNHTLTHARPSLLPPSLLFPLLPTGAVHSFRAAWLLTIPHLAAVAFAGSHSLLFFHSFFAYAPGVANSISSFAIAIRWFSFLVQQVLNTESFHDPRAADF